MLMWLKNWYGGKTELLDFENDPNSGVFVFPAFITHYHWTARLARALVDFYFKHWQWMWGTAIASATLWVAVLSMK